MYFDEGVAHISGANKGHHILQIISSWLITPESQSPLKVLEVINRKSPRYSNNRFCWSQSARTQGRLLTLGDNNPVCGVLSNSPL